jgi:hypothetical protein
MMDITRTGPFPVSHLGEIRIRATSVDESEQSEQLILRVQPPTTRMPRRQEPRRGGPHRLESERQLEHFEFCGILLIGTSFLPDDLQSIHYPLRA